MPTETKRNGIINVSVNAQFNYSLIVWVFPNRTLSHRIKCFHERCLNTVRSNTSYFMKRILFIWLILFLFFLLFFLYPLVLYWVWIPTIQNIMFSTLIPKPFHIIAITKMEKQRTTSRSNINIPTDLQLFIV